LFRSNFAFAMFFPLQRAAYGAGGPLDLGVTCETGVAPKRD